MDLHPARGRHVPRRLDPRRQRRDPVVRGAVGCHQPAPHRAHGAFEYWPALVGGGYLNQAARAGCRTPPACEYLTFGRHPAGATTRGRRRSAAPLQTVSHRATRYILDDSLHRSPPARQHPGPVGDRLPRVRGRAHPAGRSRARHAGRARPTSSARSSSPATGSTSRCHEQFVIYLQDIATGTWARRSVPPAGGRPDHRATADDHRAELLALTFAIGVGVPLGIISAYRRNSAADVGTMVFANIGVSIPVFVLGPGARLHLLGRAGGTPFALPPSGRNSGVSCRLAGRGMGPRGPRGHSPDGARLPVRHLHPDRADHVPMGSARSTRSVT